LEDFLVDGTPIEDVRDSTVPLFVAQGTRDDTTLPADLFTLEAIGEFHSARRLFAGST
jgi:hypothetical protein